MTERSECLLCKKELMENTRTRPYPLLSPNRKQAIIKINDQSYFTAVTSDPPRASSGTQYSLVNCEAGQYQLHLGCSYVFEDCKTMCPSLWFSVLHRPQCCHSSEQPDTGQGQGRYLIWLLWSKKIPGSFVFLIIGRSGAKSFRRVQKGLVALLNVCNLLSLHLED